MTTKRTLTCIAAALFAALAAAPALADEREDCYNDCIAAGGDRESCYAQCYGDDNGDDDCYDDCIADGGSPEACRERCAGDEGGDSDPVTRIAEWLEMSQDQIEEWQGILQAMRETLQPLLEQLQQLEEQYGAEIRSENPDRELIGQLVLEMEDLRFEIGTVQTQAIADMVIVLTAEQTETAGRFLRR
jgi:Spy/CpxP family protein refolding chaperone